ncbi:hypothetical protein DES40_0897 [Litorimonas taeanensis]|uniref:Sensory transduction regulator n=1 Tax=Litorimonas taeanensis TaxID=568099 RepID=A0A420WKY8_9PROT|nr:YbjN domain-containing protein [Litorimonas taeanensis]RKQ71572.1 hypothetical protein DES40_0897 [Litorimonas taeanensis]
MSFADHHCIRPSPSLTGMNALRGNPISVFERLSIAEGYDLERISENEIEISISGLWRDHMISLIWNASSEKIQCFLMFDSKTPGGRTDDICRLMSLINENLDAGHFDYSSQFKTLIYRNSLSLRGGAKLKTEQAMDLIASALDAAERGYPACQYVVWAGKSPEDALSSALMDLAGFP